MYISAIDIHTVSLMTEMAVLAQLFKTNDIIN